MTTILLVMAIAVVILVNLDVLLTTVGSEGQALFSLRLCRTLFAACRAALAGRDVLWVHRLAGPSLMGVLVISWIALLVPGWALFFGSTSAAVVASSGGPTGFAHAAAHSGHLISTLGGGITTPGGVVWALAGVVTAVNGMIVMTLAVTFVLSTTQAVSAGRRFCAMAQADEYRTPLTFATLGPALADLTAALNAAPFALFYSAADPKRRLPARLVRFVRAKEAADALGPYRPLLRELPGFTADEAWDDARFAAALASWTQDYNLVPMPREARPSAHDDGAPRGN